MIGVRPVQESDRRLVVATFLDSYRKNNYAGLIPYKMWWDTMRPVAVEILLDGPGVKTLVAYCPGESNPDADVYGWIAYREADVPQVVYCYVKGLYRGMGLSRLLFREAGIDPTQKFIYSASTKHCREIADKGLIPKAEFDPQALRKECKTRTKAPKVEHRKSGAS